MSAEPTVTHARRGLLALVVAGGLLVGLPLVAGADPGGPSLPTIPGPGGTSSTTTTTEDQTTTSTTEARSTTTTEQETTSTTEGGGGIITPPTDEDDSGTSAGLVFGVGVLAFLLGLLVAGVPLALLLAARRKPAGPGQAPPGPPPVAPAPVAAGPAIGPAPSREEAAIRSQRAGLVEALISLRDQLPSEALADEAQRALAAAGITEIRPDGEVFDPARHRATDQVTAADVQAHNRVTATERVGYADGERVIRLPEVVVARHGEAT